MIRRHFTGQPQDVERFRSLVVGHSDGPHTALLFQPAEPLLGNGRISQIPLVKHFDDGRIAAQGRDQRVFAAERQARIHDLNNEIHLRHYLFDFLAGLVHVPWKPVNGHG